MSTLCFETLCPDVLLLILERVTDLHTLYNILAASPAALDAFSVCPGPVFESVLAGSKPCLPVYVQELIRAVALVRAGNFPIASFEDLVCFLRHGKLPGVKGNKDDGLVPMVLDSKSLMRAGAAAPILRSTLATARQLDWLARACLDAYRARIAPGRLAPLQYDRERAVSLFRPPSPATTSTPARVAALAPTACTRAVGDAGPPSWTETMRVLRALWVIQLCRDLQAAGGVAGTLSHWPAKDVALMVRTGPEELADRVATTATCGAQEEVLAVQAYLDVLGGRSAMPTPEERALSMEAGGRGKEKAGRRQSADVQQWKALKCCLAEQDRLSSSLDDVSAGLRMFRRCQDDASQLLAGVPFDPYGRLGFALWDQRRMHLLGLAGSDKDEDGDGGQSADDLLHCSLAWRSLLPQNEVNALQEA